MSVKFHRLYRHYKELIDNRLAVFIPKRKPHRLYDPIRYILRAGGKRVRPVLTLLACEAVGGRAAHALDLAVAVEILHNFTLVHDDIMDNADTRRGLQTVHTKWDTNAAILAGDQMIALAYQSLVNAQHTRANETVAAFTRAFHEVCEGQGLDEEFENRRSIRMRDYIRMIDKKTAAMLAAATTLGGIAGGGTSGEIQALRAYGHHLGRAFQIQDDLLDLLADVRTLGKKIGSDVKEGKKTYPWLRGIERSRGTERAFLQRVIHNRKIIGEELKKVRDIFEKSGVIAEGQELVRKNTRRAQQALRSLRPHHGIAARARAMLTWLASELAERTC